MTMLQFCAFTYDGLGIECRRCGCWQRGGVRNPECPPYITRMEPDGERLPHIKTLEQNRAAHAHWLAEEEERCGPPRFISPGERVAADDKS